MNMGFPPANPLSDEQFQAIARALADPRRFAILQQIAGGGERTACSALNQHECITPATISHHIKELSESGLIRVERVGRGSNLFFCRDTWNAYRERLAAL